MAAGEHSPDFNHFPILDVRQTIVTTSGPPGANPAAGQIGNNTHTANALAKSQGPQVNFLSGRRTYVTLPKRYPPHLRCPICAAAFHRAAQPASGRQAEFASRQPVYIKSLGDSQCLPSASNLELFWASSKLPGSRRGQSASSCGLNPHIISFAATFVGHER